MPSVDNRVVSMEFNNSSFEQKVANTITSISKLKASLDFSKSTKNLQDLNAAGNNVNFNGMASAIENISSKISALGVIAATVISNITTQALQMAGALAKSFTIDPIKEGFQEYETNINSIQTILANTASKGTTLDQVNESLKQLNEYSDKTIYNFSQMARNIGTFTAAGVDLETSVLSIKGIANLAAMSGSTSEQASTAMYQLSQAIAAGSVKLMDWNSVVNAGMGGEAFKTALFETGKAMGTLADVPMGMSFKEWEDAGNSFRETLQDGWITADVLTTTLSAFTGDLSEEALIAKGYTQEQATELVKTAKLAVAAATEVKTFSQLINTVKESIQTGWADSFAIVIGNFTEAKELFTNINDSIGEVVSKNAEARNNMLAAWKFFGGRDTLLQGLKDGLAAVGSIITSIKYAFRDVFPPVTARTLIELTQRFAEFMKNLMPAPETLTKITQIFRGLFSVLSIGWEFIKIAAGAFRDLFSAVAGAITPGLLDFFAELGNKLFKLQQTLVEGGGLKDFFNELKDSILGFFGAIGGGAGGAAVDGATGAFDRLGERFGWLTVLGEKLSTVWQGLIGIFDKIGEVISGGVDRLQEVLGEGVASLGDGVANALGTADFSNVFDVLNTGLFAVIALSFRKFVNGGLKFDLGNGMFENISNSFEELTGTLSAMQSNIKADTLMKIAISMGVLVASLLVLSLIDSAALTRALVAMGVAFGELAGMLAALTAITSNLRTTASIMGMASALILLGAAILILSISVKILSSMSWSELAKGLVGVGVLLAAITLAVNNMPDEGQLFKAGLAMIGMAVAIGILSLAVKIMATMTWDELIRGLGGVAAALGLLVLAVNLLPSEGQLVKAGISMIFMAGALGLMALAVKAFSMMELGQMIQGLIGVGVALALLVATVNLLPNEASMLAIGAGLLMIGVGLVAVATAVAILGNMELSSLIQGLAAVAAVLLALGLAVTFIQGSIIGAVALLIVAGALVVLAFAIGMFSAVKWEDILKALATLAGILIIFAAASILLAATIPTMLALGAALLVFGAGALLVGGAVMLAGLGIMFLAQGLGALISTIAGNMAVVTAFLDMVIEKIPGFIAALATGVTQALQIFITALPGLISGFGDAMIAFYQLIIDTTPKLMEAVGVLISSLITLLGEKVPEFITLGLNLLLALLTGISDNIQLITDTAAQIIINFLNALSARMAEIVQAGLNVLIQFLYGIGANIGQVYAMVAFVITEMIKGIGNMAGQIVQAGADALIQFVTGIGNEIYRVVDAGFDMITKLMEGVANRSVQFADDCFTILTNFLNALSDVIDRRAPELRAAGLRLVGAIIDGITGGLSSRVGEIIEPFKNAAQDALDAVKGIFGISSPSKAMIEMMGYVAAGMVVGLKKDTTASKAAEQFGVDFMLKMNEAMANATARISEMGEFNPTITPVLDLTNVERNASKMNSLLGKPKIDAALSFDRASAISAASTASTDSGQAGQPVVQEIKFEQTINAPKALSAADIYRNTKTQLTMAKEELKIS